MSLRTVHLNSLNANITCSLCGGYFVEATTIMECLHSCKCYLRLCQTVHDSACFKITSTVFVGRTTCKVQAFKVERPSMEISNLYLYFLGSFTTSRKGFSFDMKEAPESSGVARVMTLGGGGGGGQNERRRREIPRALARNFYVQGI